MTRYRLGEGELSEVGFKKGIVTQIDSEMGVVVCRHFLKLDIPEFGPAEQYGEGLRYQNQDEADSDFFTSYHVDGIDEVYPEDYLELDQHPELQAQDVRPGSLIHVHDMATGAMMPSLSGEIVLGTHFFSFVCIGPVAVDATEIDDFLHAQARDRISRSGIL